MIHLLLTSELPWQRMDAITFLLFCVFLGTRKKLLNFRKLLLTSELTVHMLKCIVKRARLLSSHPRLFIQIAKGELVPALVASIMAEFQQILVTAFWKYFETKF